ncbi:hypothetical protein ACFLZK_00390 [Patescibacteria group bacterium]
MKSLKSLFKYILPTLVFLVVLEIIIRFIDTPPYPNSNKRYMFQEDEIGNFEPTPKYENTVSLLETKFDIYIDELGLRNVHNGPVGVEKTDKKRILFVGDSMTFGTGVNAEDTFSFKFNETDRYEGFNLGVSSYGTF